MDQAQRTRRAACVKNHTQLSLDPCYNYEEEDEQQEDNDEDLDSEDEDLVLKTQQQK